MTESSISSVYGHPLNKFAAGFIGSPAMNFINGKLAKSDKFFFLIDKLNEKIELDEMHYKKLQPYLGKEIIIGIRPEDIFVGTEKSSAENISVQIEVVEPMGNETLLYFALQNTQMIARGNPNQSYKTGSICSMHFNKSKMHFFDKESSIAI